MSELPVQIVCQRIVNEDKNRYIIYFDINGDDMVSLDPKEIKKAMIDRIDQIDPSLLKIEWMNQVRH